MNLRFEVLSIRATASFDGLFDGGAPHASTAMKGLDEELRDVPTFVANSDQADAN